MRFVQLSDPHVVVPEKQPVFGHDTIARLERAVDEVNRLHPAPECVILTGDLTNDEAPASYEIVRALLDKLTVPVHVLPGNHDARIPFRRIMLREKEPKPDRIYDTFMYVESINYRIILLDTLDEGHVPGVIDDTQLAWLEETLDTYIPVPVIVCCHHPPLPVGVPWMDALMLRDADRLVRILDRHPHACIVLCGHVHHPFRIERIGTTYLTAPAVSVQFRKEPLPPPAEKPRALLSDEPPAFRILDVHANGFETSIHPFDGA